MDKSSTSPFIELMERFAALGGVDLDLPDRSDPAGVVDFDEPS